MGRRSNSRRRIRTFSNLFDGNRIIFEAFNNRMNVFVLPASSSLPENEGGCSAAAW